MSTYKIRILQLSHLLEKNVSAIRFLEDSGLPTPLSLPSEDSAEAGPRAPPRTTSPQQPPHSWQRNRHFALLNPSDVSRGNKLRVIDNSSHNRAISKPAQGTPGAQFLDTIPLCFWIRALDGMSPSLGIAHLGIKPSGQ